MSIVQETGILRQHYEEAVADARHKSSAFWQAYLQRAFFETDIYSVTPDGSRRRADIVVKKYDATQRATSVMLWVECKYPSGSLHEAERQARDAALRCIEADGTDLVYVVTTIGVMFRAWCVTSAERGLEPLHGASVEADRRQYIGADTADAWVLAQTVQNAKNHVVPSPYYGGGEAEQEQVASQSYYGAEAEPNSTAAGWASAASSKPAFLVEVQKISHNWRANEYVFWDSRGHRRSTEKDEWEQLYYNGEKMWAFRHKKAIYLARKLG